MDLNWVNDIKELIRENVVLDFNDAKLRIKIHKLVTDELMKRKINFIRVSCSPSINTPDVIDNGWFLLKIVMDEYDIIIKIGPNKNLQKRNI